ncbi:MAG: high frequency lysogenization protein HflD [bacterium]|nr:lysogenization regulator HflD [Pseudomonadales bacterium]
MLAYEKRVLALAGVLQSIHLVTIAARSGMITQDSLENSLKSVFVQNPKSFSDIYSGTRDIRLGLTLLSDVLENFNIRTHGELVRYCLGIMALERGLSRRPDILNQIGSRLTAIDQQNRIDESEQGFDNSVASLAELYESTLSRMHPRLRVEGSRHHLQNTANVQRIRALLLSAIRSAVLWRQVGGRRWQLILSRHKMKSALYNVL